MSYDFNLWLNNLMTLKCEYCRYYYARSDKGDRPGPGELAQKPSKMRLGEMGMFLV